MSSTPRPSKKTKLTVVTAGSTTPAFKKFLEAGKSKSRVLSNVERTLLARPRDTSRSTTVLHPSEMVRDDWCHRASYFLLRGAEPAPEPASRRGLKTHLVFQVGHAIHDLWQSLFAGMDTLYGTWRCNQCGYLVKKITNEPACALHGTDTTWKYAEVPAVDKELRISGKADGILVGYGDPLLLEVKSMSKGTFMFEDRDLWYSSDQNYETAWRNMKSPFSKHVLQAQMYMRLLEGSEIAPKEALILYHSKPDNEVKEFVVAKSNFGIADIFEAAAMIVDAVSKNTPPQCNINGNALCSKCEGYK